MTFEEALRKMKDGYQVALEHPTDPKIYKIINGEIRRYIRGEWVGVLFDSEELLSNDWYGRR